MVSWRSLCCGSGELGQGAAISSSRRKVNYIPERTINTRLEGDTHPFDIPLQVVLLLGLGNRAGVHIYVGRNRDIYQLMGNSLPAFCGVRLGEVRFTVFERQAVIRLAIGVYSKLKSATRRQCPACSIAEAVILKGM